MGSEDDSARECNCSDGSLLNFDNGIKMNNRCIIPYLIAVN